MRLYTTGTQEEILSAHITQANCDISLIHPKQVLRHSKKQNNGANTTRQMEVDMEFFDDSDELTEQKVTSLTVPRYVIYRAVGHENWDAYHEGRWWPDVYADSSGYGTFESARQWCIDHEAKTAKGVWYGVF